MYIYIYIYILYIIVSEAISCVVIPRWIDSIVSRHLTGFGINRAWKICTS